MQGMRSAMPITLGTSVIAVVANFPIPAWVDFLTNIGVHAIATDFISVTLSLLAIYVVGAIAYYYAQGEEKNGLICSVITTASFLSLIPLNISVGEEIVKGFSLDYLGSSGIFVAMICGIFVSKFYCFLNDKNLRLKLPDSVPPMISITLEPTFIAMILFTLVFFLKYAFTLTPFGDIFNAVNTIVSQPVLAIGTSPWSVIIFYMLANFFWSFGIHPAPLISAYVPVLMTMKVSNIEAFTSGEPLPYLVSMIVGASVYIGGNGNTLGLCIATFFAKSEKYKSMRKLITFPNLFNINEPVIFGFPIVLNPIYVIPMTFSALLAGSVTIGLLKIIPINLNPTVSMPWVTPGFVTAFLQGGLPLLSIWLVALLCHFLIYLPFFRVDDRREYLIEQEKNPITMHSCLRNFH